MEISDDPEDPRADSVNSVYEGRSNAKRTSMAPLWQKSSKGFRNSTKLDSSKANGLLRFTSIQVNADHAVKPHVHSSNLGGSLGKHDDPSAPESLG